MKTSWNNLAQLTDAGCGHWAAMTYWNHGELIFLSMGFDPAGEEQIWVDEESATKTGSEYVRRHQLLLRACQTAHLELIHLDNPMEGQPCAGVEPLKATVWAKENFPSFPPRLYKAVIQRHLNSQPEGPVSPEPHRETATPLRETSSLQNTYRHAESQSGDTELKGNAGTRARWNEARDPLIALAVSFMEALLDMGCLCSHDRLALITYENALDCEGHPLNTRDGKNIGLKGQIKAKAKAMVPTTRRFGDPGYKAESCHCPIQDHKKFKHSRHSQ